VTREIYSFAKAVSVVATKTDLEFRSHVTELEWDRPESWPNDAVRSAVGRRSSYEVATLVEMGLATAEDQTCSVPYDHFAELDRQEIKLHTLFSEPSPFLLHIDRVGVIGRPDFLYKFHYLLGGRPVPLQRMGYYLHRAASSQTFHLDANHFELLDAMERFNALPLAARNPQASWMAFADVKRLSSEVKATLDPWLGSNDVIVPSSIGLDFYEASDGSLSFIPTSSSLDNDDFRTVFERNPMAHGFYTLEKRGQGTVRIVLSEKQKAVLERMKRVQKVRGELKEAILRDPVQIFDGIAGDVEIPDSYSDRVIGIGHFVYTPVPKADTDEVGLGELWTGTSPSSEERAKTPPSEEAKNPKKTLLIETNELSVDDRYLSQSEQARRSKNTWTFQSPRSLSPTCQLKEHQVVGVEWLQRCSQLSGRTGVLLADDMGVGKTLQLLTFLAWCIESGSYPELSRTAPPFRPILITAPLILLETQTWEKEMKRFFAERGNIFWPVLPLYGPELKGYRRKNLIGTEGDVGRPILDLDRIRQHRVVITNYEALRDYEFSFAYHPEGQPLWSIVVSDEAQEFKTPNSRISHAIKKLQPQFRIACTGTPVENRLLDLWNIFDAVQPGLLGAAHEFVSRFERNSTNDSVAQLKNRLLYAQPNAFMLRRSKNEVLGSELPPKHIHKIDCRMSPDEIVAHQRLAGDMSDFGKTKQKLNLLHQFGRLYQHPLLLQSSGDEVSTEELKRASSKLRRVLEVLYKIRERSEKAIIFARHKDVQRMLARVVADEFKIPVRILNGDTPRISSSRARGEVTRGHMLEEFENKDGFNVIVLSPFVAGVGLTVVKANHVIHYGRWWNPAVEAQATDRVYRLGQSKEVHVYLPILRDESNQIPRTFDQLLDGLMDKKHALAETALAKQGFQPLREDEDDAGLEVFDALQNRTPLHI
jgi:hypothetical protein